MHKAKGSPKERSLSMKYAVVVARTLLFASQALFLLLPSASVASRPTGSMLPSGA